LSVGSIEGSSSIFGITTTSMRRLSARVLSFALSAIGSNSEYPAAASLRGSTPSAWRNCTTVTARAVDSS
jgi:hypothetical protein